MKKKNLKIKFFKIMQDKFSYSLSSTNLNDASITQNTLGNNDFESESQS